MYLTSSGSDYYYDALYKVKDTINIKNYITKTNVDVGFDHQGAAYKLSVLTSHNSNDTNLSLNTWASNLYWIIGD